MQAAELSCQGSVNNDRLLAAPRRGDKNTLGSVHTTSNSMEAWSAWVWTEYASGMPRHIQLNQQALRLHAAPFIVHALNRSNVRSFLPDLPEPFWRLPNQVAASDVVRAALLLKYGGLWLDADFLVLRSLQPVAQALETHSLVAYEVAGQNCAQGRISSNFVAAHRNTSLWRAIWQKTMEWMHTKCNGRVCSGGLYTWGPTLRHPVAAKLARKGELGSIYCFRGERSLHGSLAPAVTGSSRAAVKMFHVHTQSLCSPEQPSGFGCCEVDGFDLVCRRQGSSVVARSAHFFSRVAYHMFDSIVGKEYAKVENIENASLVASVLYRRALSVRQSHGRQLAAARSLGRTPHMNLAWESRDVGGASTGRNGFIGVRKVHEARKEPKLGGWWYYITPSAGGAKRWVFETRVANASKKQQELFDFVRHRFRYTRPVAEDFNSSASRPANIVRRRIQLRSDGVPGAIASPPRVQVVCPQKSSCSWFTRILCASFAAIGDQCFPDVEPCYRRRVPRPQPGLPYVAKTTIIPSQVLHAWRDIELTYRVLFLRDPIQQWMAMSTETWRGNCGGNVEKLSATNAMITRALLEPGLFDAVVFAEAVYASPTRTLEELGFGAPIYGQLTPPRPVKFVPTEEQVHAVCSVQPVLCALYRWGHDPRALKVPSPANTSFSQQVLTTLASSSTGTAYNRTLRRITCEDRRWC